MKLAVLTGLLLLASLNVGCGGGSSTSSQTSTNSPPRTITSVQVSPSTKSIAVGATQQFSATLHYSDGTSWDVTSTAAWNSSDATIVSMSGTGMANGLAAGTVNITAKSGNFTGTATLGVTAAAVNLKSITVAPAAFSMPVNTTQQFTATGTYTDGSSSDLTNVVTWHSQSNTVATINASGVVSSAAAGTTQISASLAGVTVSTTLTVTAPSIASIAVTPVGLTLGIGISQQFVATATYTDGTSSDLSSGVTWSSSTPSVASVDGNGLAKTLAAGSTTITATAGSFSDNTVLTVVPAHLVSISVSPASASIAAGTTEQLSAVGSFDDGSTQLLTSVTWSSTATGVATVDVNGLVTSVGTGSTTISASSGGVSGTSSLTVTSAVLVSLAVDPANSTTATGATKQFTALGTFSDSSTQDMTASVLWSSSNPAVATIAGSGLATSVASGTTNISAAFGTVSGSTGLTVSTAHLVGITITPANPRIARGTSIKFVATGTFSDGSTGGNLAGVSWKSSKPNIASVRGTGIAHGKKGGSVTITASSAGISGQTSLTVGTGTLSSLAVSPASPTCSVGTTQQFAATGTFSDGSTQDITLNSHWSSSRASVATIANAPSVAGLAQCSGAGVSVVGANSGGTTGSATMTVQ